MDNTEKLRQDISERMRSLLAGEISAGEAASCLNSLASEYCPSVVCSLNSIDNNSYILRVSGGAAPGSFPFKKGDGKCRISITAFRAAKFAEGIRDML